MTTNFEETADTILTSVAQLMRDRNYDPKGLNLTVTVSSPPPGGSPPNRIVVAMGPPFEGFDWLDLDRAVVMTEKFSDDVKDHLQFSFVKVLEGLTQEPEQLIVVDSKKLEEIIEPIYHYLTTGETCQK